MADFGHEVWCVDILEDRIAGLRRGEIPFFEPGLDNLVKKNHAAKRLRFTTSLAEGMAQADVVFIAVQTPMSSTGEADLTYVMQVGEQIGTLLQDYTVVVTKSTVPVGTARRLAAVIREAMPRPVAFDMASNPEFLREGSSIEDFMRPDRVVIGTESERAAEIMSEIYRPLYLLDTPIVHCNIETAELIKYASNSFLAVKISFINELASLAEKVSADISVIAKAMGLDKRIGPKFLHAGLGFGGSCLPKDTNAIVHIGQSHDVPMRVVQAAIDINAELPQRAFAKAQNLAGDLAGKKVALLGVAFKPNTDDIRSAASIPLTRALLNAGAQISAYDPVAMANFREIFPDLNYCDSAYAAATGTDLCILVTEWNEFRQLDFGRLAKIMRDRAFLDCRNVYDREHVAEHGFRYACFGQPDSPQARGEE
jgi:UDPglucose 6-dehydrogenase